MPLFLSFSIVPRGGGVANSQWYRLWYRRYRYCCWKTRTSYRLGLGQPYPLMEVSLEDHPLSPFPFRDQVLELAYLGVAEGVLVHHQLGRVAVEAAVEAAAEAA